MEELISLYFLVICVLHNATMIAVVASDEYFNISEKITRWYELWMGLEWFTVVSN